MQWSCRLTGLLLVVVIGLHGTLGAELAAEFGVHISAAPLVDDLFALESGIGAFIVLGCGGVILWTLLNRAPNCGLENGDPIEGNLRQEITWTLIPLVLVLAIAWRWCP